MNKSICRLALSLCLAACSLALNAATPAETEAKMNDVKLNENMVYGEGFDDNKDIAYGKALADLLTYANELRFEKGKESINIADVQTVAKTMDYQKGSCHFVLVYIPVSQALGLEVKTRPDVGGKSGNKKAETPATPQAKKKTDEKPKSDSRYNLIPKASTTPPDDVLTALCSQDNWSEIKGFITQYKNQGKIKETGFCTTPAEVPADAYMILIDDMYGILAILSPKNSANRINYRSGLADSESNYPNCKVIVWYK